MGDVLLKAFGFVFIIIAGIVFRRIGLFHKDDDRILSKIVLNFTLPCSVINAFSGFDMELSLLGVVALGILTNLALSFFGKTMAGKDRKKQAFNYINYSGFNIGCFTMPFVQSFLGSFGVAVTCLFDTGNAIMCTGATYAIASGLVGGEKQSFKAFLKKAFSSAPFVSYLVMLVLSLFHFRFPDPVYQVTSAVAQANAFLCMFMIGLMFEVHLSRSQVLAVVKTLSLRLLLCCAMALAIYFLLPFGAAVKQVLVLVCFSPVSAMGPVFTDRLHLDKGLAGVINSVSIPISVLILTGILLFWPPVA